MPMVDFKRSSEVVAVKICRRNSRRLLLVVVFVVDRKTPV
jgi:hypothetical protein